jgi:hypothetical protein
MVLKRNLATWKKDRRLRMDRRNRRWNGFEEKIKDGQEEWKMEWF